MTPDEIARTVIGISEFFAVMILSTVITWLLGKFNLSITNTTAGWVFSLITTAILLNFLAIPLLFRNFRFGFWLNDVEGWLAETKIIHRFRK